jgi:hypothetical protein
MYALSMRTTIRFDDQLLKEIKSAAAESGRTMTEVVEDAVRESLARRRSNGRRERVALPVFHGTGLLPGVDLDDSAALLDIMEGGDAPA